MGCDVQRKDTALKEFSRIHAGPPVHRDQFKLSTERGASGSEFRVPLHIAVIMSAMDFVFVMSHPSTLFFLVYLLFALLGAIVSPSFFGKAGRFPATSGRRC